MVRGEGRGTRNGDLPRTGVRGVERWWVAEYIGEEGRLVRGVLVRLRAI